jgi:hypothetical protein
VALRDAAYADWARVELVLAPLGSGDRRQRNAPPLAVGYSRGMRFRLRSLLTVLAISPPCIAVLWFQTRELVPFTSAVAIAVVVLVAVWWDATH